MPGGYADPRQLAIGAKGRRNIENFVKSGGNYIGFCAGSFYASQHLEWADQSHDPRGEINLNGDYNTEHNELSPDLLPGRAIGPVQWAPWKIAGKKTSATGFAPVRINLEVPTMKEIGMPENTELFYFGGPYFDISEERRPEGLEIWARAIRPNSTAPSSNDQGERMRGEDQPTVINYRLNLGKVILFSYHPIVISGGRIDGVQLTDDFSPTFPILSRDSALLDLNEMNYNSWNILYAAFRIATSMKVQSMPRPQKHLVNQSGRLSMPPYLFPGLTSQ
jgi:glutamine amidotransferase-like uncharacterized protein